MWTPRQVVALVDIDFNGSGVLLTLVAVVASVLSLAGALRLTARRGDGFFQYFPYAVLLSIGMLVFLSGRSLLSDYEMQSGLLTQSNTAAIWTTRLTSFCLMLASLERIASYALRRNRSGIAPYALLVAFVMFWSTTVASPALFGAHGSLSHDYLYTLLMGCAALLLSQRESDAVVAAARNALMVFLAISVALIPVRPALVMDSNYAGSLLPGLPRFAGLAPHSVSLGMLAQLALICLYAQPLSPRWLNRLCWALGLFALFLAQSKTSWLSFPLCVACMVWMRRDSAAWRRFGLVALVCVTVGTVGLGLTYIVGNLGFTSDSFFGGQRWAELASFTGRDRIWAVALEEWGRHQVFGYGSNLFDEAYRASIGMPFAFNGHNQFIDTLARSGLVGATGLVLYLVSLGGFSVRYAKRSRGLSLAIFLAIAFRCVSEVPLTLANYGPEVLQQVLLLAILAGQARRGRASSRANADPDSPRSSYYRGPWSKYAEYEGLTRRPTWG